MNWQIIVSGALVASVAAVPVTAQGDLGVLAQGQYICALPGDATGAAWSEQPSAGFAITSASTYRTEDGVGTYLLEGNRLSFTRGPLRGKSFFRLGSGLLQQMDKGQSLGRLRCHRSGPLPD